MMRRRACAVALALVAALGNARAQDGKSSVAPAACARGAPLPEFTLDYAVSAVRPPLRLTGTNRLQYTLAAGRYTLVSQLEAGGVYNARQQSNGTVEATGWRPLRYEESTTRRAAAAATIDWHARSVSFSGDEPPAEAPPGLQDRLSVLLQLGRDLARLPKAEQLELSIAGPRHVSRYRIEIQGRESVEVPSGRFETVRVLRLREDGDDRLELWLAPALCWLPVQLRFVEGSKQTIEQRLVAARFAPRR